MSIATPDVEARTRVESRGNTGEQSMMLDRIGYDAYETIVGVLGEKAGVRLVYVDARLTFLTASRRHEWYAERLAELVKLIASATGLNWEDSGSATYRLGEKEVGVEADKAFYLGTNADRMQGPVNIDLATQPPPDLTIEVEVTPPADDAMIVYGRIGVPEVWRFDVKSWKCSFCHRNQDGHYDRAVQSRAMPLLKVADVEEQLRLADAMGAARWFAQLPEWVRTTILPRTAEGLRAMDDRSPLATDELPEDLVQFVKPELRPGERLLWAERSRQGPSKASNRSRSGPYYAVAFLALSSGILYVVFGPLGPKLVGVEGPLIVAGVLSAVVGIINIIVPIGRRIDHGRPGGRPGTKVYALTDRRAIIWTPREGLGAVEVHAIARGSVTMVHRLEYPDGSGDVRFQYRMERFHTSQSGFEGVAHVRLVEDLVRRTLIDPGPDAIA